MGAPVREEIEELRQADNDLAQRAEVAGERWGENHKDRMLECARENRDKADSLDESLKPGPTSEAAGETFAGTDVLMKDIRETEKKQERIEKKWGRLRSAPVDPDDALAAWGIDRSDLDAERADLEPRAETFREAGWETMAKEAALQAEIVGAAINDEEAVTIDDETMRLSWHRNWAI